ncbi:MAG: hypothetical protein J2P49_02985, partial [Methylocapsa sp.]|nr:hypothetical protein [Methylocapsa sp.]
RVEYVGAASLAGSDDRKLLATLRAKGPAVFQISANGRDRFELAEGGTTAVPRAETVPEEARSVRAPGEARAGWRQAETSAAGAGMKSSETVPAPAASFKGRPVPLPPSRPAGLEKNPGFSTKLALRRTSF